MPKADLCDVCWSERKLVPAESGGQIANPLDYWEHLPGVDEYVGASIDTEKMLCADCAKKVVEGVRQLLNLAAETSGGEGR